MNKMDTRVTIGKVRFHFLYVFEPDAIAPGDKPKYKATLGWPKSDTALTEKIKGGMQAAYAEGRDKGLFKSAPPAGIIHDGDKELTKSGEPKMPGCYFIKTDSQYKPETYKVAVVNGARVLGEATPEDLYSGCYGHAVITIAGYNAMGREGLKAYLNSVLKTEDGEKLGGGGSNASLDYADIMGESAGASADAGDMPEFF